MQIIFALMASSPLATAQQQNQDTIESLLMASLETGTDGSLDAFCTVKMDMRQVT